MLIKNIQLHVADQAFEVSVDKQTRIDEFARQIDLETKQYVVCREVLLSSITINDV